MSVLSATLYGLQYDASEAFHSPVKCDGCAGWWEFEECQMDGDLLFCPGCASEPPPPPPLETDQPPSPEHAGTCDCGVELTGCGELCPPCADLTGRAEAWQEGALR